MPFGYLRLPSIALTQLKTRLDRQFKDQVSTVIHYLNLDFGDFIGPVIYDFIAENPIAMHCNFGEWLFRAAAFPEAPDNTEAYLNHFNLTFKLLPATHHSERLAEPTGNSDTKTLEFFINILLEKGKILSEFLDVLIEKHQLDQCEVVGFTSMFAQSVPVFALARKLKERNPNLIVVMGGANCESPMGEEIVRNLSNIDFVFSGPALISFPGFIDCILRNKPESCHQIDGVFSRFNLNKSNQPVAIKPRGEELDINTWIDLDYTGYLRLIKEKWKSLDITPVLLFETSRGCWWGAKAHCTFCGLNTNSMSYRAMNPEMAVLFLNRLFKKYGKRVKHYSSVDNIMPREYLQTVFPKLEVPDDFSIFYEVKADLTKEELEILARARIKTLQPGIESLNTATLKLMKKGETAVGNISLLKNSSALGIHLAWNLLLGFPGDPESAYQVYDDTMDQFYHLQPPKSIYTVRFDRYSPYFMKSAEYGLYLVPADFYYFLYPNYSLEKLSELAYYFEDANTEAEYKKLCDQWLPSISGQIDRWAKRYYTEDNLLKPVLFYDPITQTVHDSRSGQLRIQALTPLGAQVLFALDQPTKLITLLQIFQHIDPIELDETLNEMIDRKYVYHENRKKYISLVHTPIENPMKVQFNKFSDIIADA